VLGFELGLARAVGAILFAFLIGLGMHLFFLREERAKAEAAGWLRGQPPTSKQVHADIGVIIEYGAADAVRRSPPS